MITSASAPVTALCSPPCSPPSMAPSPWATPEQQRFLDEEDLKWETIKLDGTTLKSFYLNTTHTFLERWPIIPEKAILEEAGSDVVKARRLAEHQLYEVSILIYSTPRPLTPYGSGSRTGSVTTTIKRRKPQQSPNHSSTSVENIPTRNRRYRSGRRFYPCTAVPESLHCVRR